MSALYFVSLANFIIRSNSDPSECWFESSSQTMEVVNFKHSTKDIPVPSKKLIFNMAIDSAEKFLYNLRWRVLNFLYPFKNSGKETYEFNSNKHPDRVPELVPFENDMLDLVKNIQFKHIHSNFQRQLRSECETIENEEQLLVSADKTSNFYKVKPEEYNKMLEKEINDEYKKAKEPFIEEINNAHKKVVRSLDLSDRVFQTKKSESFITLKDHKPNFENSPSCRLIAPTKCEIGRISHQILAKIVENVRIKSKLKQWKNVYSCLDWFKDLKNKSKLSFIIFDIASFYPSITCKLLVEALKWAKKFTDISSEDIKIILEARKVFLVSKGEFWVKKNNPEFDVTMGGYDSAEVCDIVGLFLLSKLEELGLKAEFGLFKDDGLAASNTSPRGIENIKKKICELFKKFGLRITIEANKKVVQYLDVELNLNNGTYKPYIKPNDVPLYVNKDSSHPPHVIKNIPEAVNRRLSALSSNQELFDSVKAPYQEALNNAGYDYVLEYHPVENCTKKKTRRRRQITWFDPPWSSNIKTDIGRKFLNLIDKHFPKGNKLYKVINRNTVKVSYRTTPNLQKIISRHNSKIQRNIESIGKKTCNCLKSRKENCPLDGKCLTESLIYQATVTTSEPVPKVYTYIGNTGNDFKERFRNHEKSFNHYRYKTETTLSSFIWDELKSKNINYNVKFRVVDRAPSFNPITRICKLCTLERYYLIFKPELATINDHNEFTRPCRHKDKVLLDKT